MNARWTPKPARFECGRSRFRPFWLAGLFGLAASACYTGPSRSTGDTDMGDEGDATDGAGGDGSGDGFGDVQPAKTPRAYRLTHAQWENTVQDLLGFAAPTGLSSNFVTDPKVAGFIFDNDASTLAIDEALWNGYRVAAGEAASMATADPQTYARLAGPFAENDDSEGFVRNFALRAYRRPPTQEEVDELVELFEAAPAFYSDESDPFVAGVRHVVEAVLQSPLFLYRIETSQVAEGDSIALSDYEVAQRLSYFVTDTMPDDDLFAAAQTGALTTKEGVEAEARRLLGSPRAARTVAKYHAQLLNLDKVNQAAPSPAFYPDAPPDLADLAATEQDHFVKDVVFAGGGGLAELLTSKSTYVNDDLARLYGVEGDFGDAFERVDLEAAQRSGVFTQSAFLVANATAADPDPIHRGVFLAERIVCLDIAAPPNDIPPLPPYDEDQTNRERIEAHTEAEGTVCAACHQPLINPYGFVFEHYDALGAWRDVDRGKPVDSAVEILLDGTKAPVSDAVALADELARSPAVHDCYAKHWVEFATGMPHDAAVDLPLVKRLGTASLNERQSIEDLMVALVTSEAFRKRAIVELE